MLYTMFVAQVVGALSEPDIVCGCDLVFSVTVLVKANPSRSIADRDSGLPIAMAIQITPDSAGLAGLGISMAVPSQLRSCANFVPDVPKLEAFLRFHLIKHHDMIWQVFVKGCQETWHPSFQTTDLLSAPFCHRQDVRRLA